MGKAIDWNGEIVYHNLIGTEYEIESCSTPFDFKNQTCRVITFKYDDMDTNVIVNDETGIPCDRVTSWRVSSVDHKYSAIIFVQENGTICTLSTDAPTIQLAEDCKREVFDDDVKTLGYIDKVSMKITWNNEDDTVRSVIGF